MGTTRLVSFIPGYLVNNLNKKVPNSYLIAYDIREENKQSKSNIKSKLKVYKADYFQDSVYTFVKKNTSVEEEMIKFEKCLSPGDSILIVKLSEIDIKTIPDNVK